MDDLLMMPTVTPLRLHPHPRIQRSWDQRRNHAGVIEPHHAVDIPAPEGTVIQSTTDGRVVRVHRNTTRTGNGVTVRDADGDEHLYAHMRDAPAVDVGDRVAAGDVLGVVGSTGNARSPHLHYGMRTRDGEAIDMTGRLQALVGQETARTQTQVDEDERLRLTIGAQRAWARTWRPPGYADAASGTLRRVALDTAMRDVRRVIAAGTSRAEQHLRAGQRDVAGEEVGALAEYVRRVQALTHRLANGEDASVFARAYRGLMESVASTLQDIAEGAQGAAETVLEPIAEAGRGVLALVAVVAIAYAVSR